MKIWTFVFASVGVWSRTEYLHETIKGFRSNFPILCSSSVCDCSRKPWKWQSLGALHSTLKLIFIHDAYDKLYVYLYMCMYSIREVIDCEAIVIGGNIDCHRNRNIHWEIGTNHSLITGPLNSLVGRNLQ